MSKLCQSQATVRSRLRSRSDLGHVVTTMLGKSVLCGMRGTSGLPRML